MINFGASKPRVKGGDLGPQGPLDLHLVCIPACTVTDTPLADTPWQIIPWQTPPCQAPPGRHTPADKPPDSHYSGRYASYWNAFLFTILFVPSSNYNFGSKVLASTRHRKLFHVLEELLHLFFFSFQVGQTY